MEFKIQIFQAWKVLESGVCPSKLGKVMENPTKWLPHFWPAYTKTHLPARFCQTYWGSLSTPPDPLVTLSQYIWKSDFFDNHWKVIKNGHKWSSKVLENVRKKVLENRGKSLSVFCMHPIICTLWYTLHCTLCYVYAVCWAMWRKAVKCSSLVVIKQLTFWWPFSKQFAQVKVKVGYWV